MSSPTPPAVEMLGIDKRFGAVHANRAVDLTVEKGSIHGLIGENGAGKSTLMSILYGFYQADAGEIRIDGKPADIVDSRAAISHGIDMVHQHFMLIDTMTVLENIILGSEGGPLLRRRLAEARLAVTQLARKHRLDVDPDARISDLAVGTQQRVEILKALYRGAHTLILDEPTAVLTPQETDDLFHVLEGLRQDGHSIILVTHKLREIMAFTDRVSVMRGGQMVANRVTAATSPEELGELMIGRKVAMPIRTAMQTGQALLSVTDLVVRDNAGTPRVKGASFSVRAGEIVGIAGISGNGQTELLEALSGIRRPASGMIQVGGQPVFPNASFSPASLRAEGVAHVPEDRLRTGLVPSFIARESAILGYQGDPGFRHGPLIRWPVVELDTARKMEAFDVRPRAPRLKSANFSGGNQQKLILAREMERDPLILLVGQPTRGVDIGGIAFIHERILAMRQAGKAILLISVELDEIRRLSDRILVMCDGNIVGELAADADERQLGLMMAGIAGNARPVEQGTAP